MFAFGYFIFMLGLFKLRTGWLVGWFFFMNDFSKLFESSYKLLVTEDCIM